MITRVTILAVRQTAQARVALQMALAQAERGQAAPPVVLGLE